MTTALRKHLRLRYLMAEIDAKRARDYLCSKPDDQWDDNALLCFDIASFTLQQCREEWLDACT